MTRVMDFFAYPPVDLAQAQAMIKIIGDRLIPVLDGARGTGSVLAMSADVRAAFDVALSDASQQIDAAAARGETVAVIRQKVDLPYRRLAQWWMARAPLIDDLVANGELPAEVEEGINILRLFVGAGVAFMADEMFGRAREA